ncbi:MAG: glycosyltransferase family 4 protein [Magnetococcales bacterium]|nr:glycosyltransferase family 4 protein [Magnetococcales bacterium]
MKVLFLLSKRQPPSSRLRMANCIDGYRKAGVECTILPIQSGIFGRIAIIRLAKRHDIVLIQKKTSFKSFELKLLQKANPRIIFDFDDAVMFHELEHHKPFVGKHFVKFIRTINHCAAVVAGNEFLASFSRPNCPDVRIMPTPVDLNYNFVKTHDLSNTGELLVGWLGVNGNLHYLDELAPVFQKLVKKYPNFRLKIVSNDFIDITGVPIVKELWSLDGEAAALRSMDVGIMPLNNSLWAQGKCGYKLLQYMSAGVPVVASPVGINQEFIQQGVNGFLATDHEQWFQALSKLLDDASLRRDYGLAGRAMVEEKYSQERYEAKYLALFNDLLSR